MTTPYVTGTVSVTAGSAVVTGVGTAWQTALIAGGLFGLDSSNGNPVPILSVDSNTQITLAKPWRGTTASDQGYWIIRDTAYLQQLSANAQALATYIQRLDNATLAALASLTPEAKKIPYFSGSAAAALIDLKDAAKALLALDGVADKLAYYTSTSAVALTDLKAKGRDILNSATTLELLGKFGPVFGGSTPVPSSADVGLSDGNFNTITVPGAYTITGTWSNGPQGSGTYTGVLEVHARIFNNGYWQILRLGTATWMRYTGTSGAATWPNPWMRISNETVGTVSQSGGVPTGAIIERGTNANGSYTKWADGTLVCAGHLELAVAQIGAAGNYLFPITFPSTFVLTEGNPRMVATPGYSAAATGSFNNTIRWGIDRYPQATGGGIMIQMSGAVGTTLQFNWVCYGRWV
ncbi:phage tail protein [Ensifer aridi]|uniref:phage tail protein n=1 Tax=Ensifer aridi TaxID=1708715 RepID=UPI001FCE0F49|nr:phage tail protein [Ensifer aridi]